MKLPIDIPAVIKAATDIQSAAQTELSVSLYLDDTAPGDLVGHVRSLFSSDHATTRITIEYLGERPIVIHDGDDMAVIVAGTSPSIGKDAASLREAGTPVMVITTSPDQLNERLDSQGDPIPDGDVIYPYRPLPFNLSEKQEDHREPFILDDENLKLLDERIGRWIISACEGKKLAFALAFPFVRRPLSTDSVNATSIQNAGIGVVVFLPGADLPLMTLNQAKMLLQIAAAYGQPMDINRIKELAAVVGGAFLMRNIARQLVKLVPVLGWLIKGVVGFTGTQAMGRAAIDYFEAGGDLVGLANVVQKTRDEVIEVAEKAVDTPAGQKVITSAKSALSRGFQKISSRS